MAATIPVFLKHTFISKTGQDRPYTARAHSRYIQRQSATHSVHTHLMPENYNARQRWFFDHENGLRKNGRVIDKFTITVPYAVSEEHAAATLMEFGKWLGQERCPFMFSLQGFDTNNHHAHFIFIDRDVENGARVYGTTEYNSTRGIKLEWETTANNMFAALGYDVQVKVHEGRQPENDNHIGNVNVAVGEPPKAENNRQPQDVAQRADAPTSTDTQLDQNGGQSEEIPTNPIPEDDMAKVHGTLERPHDADVSEAAHRVRKIHTADTELQFHAQLSESLSDTQFKVGHLIAMRERASAERDQHFEEMVRARGQHYAASENLSGLQTGNGGYQGVHVKIALLGIDFKSAKRQKAEQAAAEERQRAFDAQRAADIAKEYEYHIQQLSNRLAEAMTEAEMLRNEMETADSGKRKKELQREVRRQIDGNEDVEAIRPNEGWAAWQAGDITDDEIRSYCVHSGNKHMLGELEEAIGLEEGGASL